MDITNSLSDQAVLTTLGERLATLRLNKNLTQAQLAKEAGISPSTLTRIEAGEPSSTTNLLRVLRALGALENLDLLVPEPSVSPIQQLKLAGKTRQRARQSSKKTEAGIKEPEAWSWDQPETSSPKNSKERS